MHTQRNTCRLAARFRDDAWYGGFSNELVMHWRFVFLFATVNGDAERGGDCIVYR
jgi:hypothetical protein